MKKIKILLIEKNKTALEMSRDLKISPSSLSMYIGGWRNPTEEVQTKIAFYLGVSREDLFKQRDELHPLKNGFK